jgi:uncharacterized protein YecE (DUF72 family)
VLQPFKESLQPLIDAGKLGCVLVQFPQATRRWLRLR